MRGRESRMNPALKPHVSGRTHQVHRALFQLFHQHAVVDGAVQAFGRDRHRGKPRTRATSQPQPRAGWRSRWRSRRAIFPAATLLAMASKFEPRGEGGCRDAHRYTTRAPRRFLRHDLPGGGEPPSVRSTFVGAAGGGCPPGPDARIMPIEEIDVAGNGHPAGCPAAAGAQKPAGWVQARVSILRGPTPTVTQRFVREAAAGDVRRAPQAGLLTASARISLGRYMHLEQRIGHRSAQFRHYGRGRVASRFEQQLARQQPPWCAAPVGGQAQEHVARREYACRRSARAGSAAPTMKPARSYSPRASMPGISAVSPPISAQPLLRQALARPPPLRGPSASSMPIAK